MRIEYVNAFFIVCLYEWKLWMFLLSVYISERVFFFIVNLYEWNMCVFFIACQNKSNLLIFSLFVAYIYGGDQDIV